VRYAAIIWSGKIQDPVPELIRSKLLGESSPPQEIWNGIWISVVASELTPGMQKAIGERDPSLEKLMALYTLIPPDRKTHGPIAYFSFSPSDLWRPGGSLIRYGIRHYNDLIYYDSAESTVWRFGGYFVTYASN